MQFSPFLMEALTSIERVTAVPLDLLLAIIIHSCIIITTNSATLAAAVCL